MRNAGVWVVAVAVALGSASCDGSPQPVGEGQPAPAAHLVALPWPPAADLGVPPLDGLTDGGRLALKVLLDARYFTTDTVYKGGVPSLEVEAWKVLFAEREAGAAFLYLSKDTIPPRPGCLFGLCGLWHTDRAAFKEGVAALRESYPNATVPIFFGCEIDESAPLIRVLTEIEEGRFPRMFRGKE